MFPDSLLCRREKKGLILNFIQFQLQGVHTSYFYVFVNLNLQRYLYYTRCVNGEVTLSTTGLTPSQWSSVENPQSESTSQRNRFQCEKGIVGVGYRLGPLTNFTNLSNMDVLRLRSSYQTNNRIKRQESVTGSKSIRCRFYPKL